MFALVKLNETGVDRDGKPTQYDTISLFQPYTLWQDKSGIQHAPDELFKLSTTQKQDLGIYDVAYGTHLDEQFYTVTQNAPTFDKTAKIVRVTYTSTAKPLADVGDIKGLKSNWISNFNQNVNALLSQTDWMLVRKIERNVAVPSAVATQRAAIITENNRLATAITAASTVEALITAVKSANFPTGA